MEGLPLTEAKRKLRSCSLFARMPEKELEALLRDCEPSEWDRGATIDNDGGIERFNIILDGSVKLMHTDAASGRSIVLFLLHRGDVFDVLSLLDGKEHYCVPVAAEAVRLLRMPMEKARAWLTRSEAFNAAFLPYLGSQMRTLESFAESLVFDDTATRLARLILHHADIRNPTPEGHLPVRLINNLSHELLAEMIGSVRTVVTTQLQKLKKEELILQERGRILVRDLEALKRRYGL